MSEEPAKGDGHRHPDDQEEQEAADERQGDHWCRPSSRTLRSGLDPVRQFFIADLDRPERHEGQADGADAVDDAHGPIDDHHGLGVHDLGHLPAQDRGVGEEDDADDVHDGRQRPRHPVRHVHVQELDVDVAVAPDRQAAAEEPHAHQEVPGDLLGPGHRIVQDVPGEELEKDNDGHGPEEGQGHPVLDPVVRQVRLGLVVHRADDHVAEVRAGIGLVFHGARPWAARAAARQCPVYGNGRGSRRLTCGTGARAAVTVVRSGLLQGLQAVVQLLGPDGARRRRRCGSSPPPRGRP